MTSKLVLLVAAIALTTVSAASYYDFYAYDDDELSQISHQIRLCLRDLPAVGGGSFPVRVDLSCDYAADRQLAKGALKEELTPTVVKCVKSYKVASPSQVSEIQQCLTDRLSQPLDQGLFYTPEQNQEIVNRIEKCLQLVPTYSEGRQPREVCLASAAETVEDGTWKENLEGQTVRCLKNGEFHVSADVVEAANQCLRKELDARI